MNCVNKLFRCGRRISFCLDMMINDLLGVNVDDSDVDLLDMYLDEQTNLTPCCCCFIKRKNNKACCLYKYANDVVPKNKEYRECVVTNVVSIDDQDIVKRRGVCESNTDTDVKNSLLDDCDVEDVNNDARDNVNDSHEDVSDKVFIAGDWLKPKHERI